MKRSLAFFLATLTLLSALTACGKGNSAGDAGGASSVDDALTGVWYSAYDSAVLDIKANGKGTVTYEGAAYDGQFSAQDGVFTATSEAYGFRGAYTLDGATLSVEIPFENETYTAIFTREALQLPEELKGTHVYQLGDKAYELIVEDGNTVCKGLPFPPSDDYEAVEVILLPKLPSDGGTPGTPVTSLEITIAPPPHIFVEKQLQGTTPSADTAPAATEGTDAEDTAPADTPSKKKPDFVPQRIEQKDGEIFVTKDGEAIPTTKGGGSIVGTWTSQKQKGQAYIFGHSSDMDYTVTFTFNADGTGTCTALIFMGTLTWSLDGHRLDLTVSMLGDTDSGTGYVTIVGDVMYLVNQKGEQYALSRTA